MYYVDLEKFLQLCHQHFPGRNCKLTEQVLYVGISGYNAYMELYTSDKSNRVNPSLTQQHQTQHMVLVAHQD